MNLRQEDGTRPFKVQRVGVHSDGGVARRSDTTCAIPRADLVPGIRSDSIFFICSLPARLCVRHHDPTAAQDAGRLSQESTTRHASKLKQVEGTDECGGKWWPFRLARGIVDLNLEFQAGDCRFDFRQFRSGPHRKQPPMDVLGARRLRLSFLVLFLPQPQNNHHSHGQENRLGSHPEPATAALSWQ